MKQLEKQRGSALIPLIGIIAAVAVMGAALVMIVANSQGFTAHERTRSKAFNVAEAALNKAMYQLQLSWPAAEGQSFTWDNEAFETALQSSVPVYEAPVPSPSGVPDDQYALPPSGLTFSSVTVTDDNADAVNPGGPWPTYDKDGDNTLRVTVQANVGDRKTRLQVNIERVFFEIMMPRGVAIYSGSNLDNSGVGNGVMPKIQIEDAPADLEVSARVVGDIDNNKGNLIETGIIPKQGLSAGSADDVFPPSLIEALTLMADYKTGGDENTDGDRYFTSMTAARNSPADDFSPQGGFSGLCVIDDGTGADLSLDGEINTPTSPGILLSLNPDSSIDMGGSGNYYGVIYVTGPLDKSHGNFVVHGSFISVSNVDMRGTVEVRYSDSAILRLNSQWALNTKMVPNTWRELTPQ